MLDLFMRRQLQHVLTPDQRLYFPYGRRAFMRSMRTWHRLACEESRLTDDALPPVTAILLSYARPWNIDPMARMLLRFSCIERLIISNNNPAVDLSSYLSVTDERMTLITQTEKRPASMMLMLASRAADSGAGYFLSIDDDLFLFPAQISRLLHELIRSPAVPHGVVGQRWNVAGFIESHVTGEGEIDVLNRAYACTSAHVHRSMRLLDVLGYTSDEAKEMLPFGSDIILSHSGEGSPRIHNVGPLLSCPTAALQGVARFKEPGFNAFRVDLYSRVQAISRE